MTANLIRVSPDRSKIFPMFFRHVLISEKFQETLNITSSSTTIRTIKAPELKRLKLAIPPLPEQKKIAEVLSTVDQAIEKNKEIIERTKELKKGLMQELLSRGIGHKKFKKTGIGEIPVEWRVAKIEDFCDILDSQRIPSPPFTEQERIAKVLSCVDEKIEKAMKRKENLGFVKKGLMQVLLTGKMRVKVEKYEN